MTPEEALEVWAPQGSPWSSWTKPVLFSFLPAQLGEVSYANVGPEQTIPLLLDAALVVELVGESGVYAGLSLAARGYRLVPLYNATPAPFPGADDALGATPALIDVRPIVKALERGTFRLTELPLPPAAPPAFLIDAARHDASFSPDSTWFDNRSMVRTTDLPSAAFLRAQGISQVVLVQNVKRVREDLSLVLLQWQDAGLRLSSQAWGRQWQPQPLRVHAPSLLKQLWTRLRLRFQFSPNSSGAFGRFSGGSGG